MVDVSHLRGRRSAAAALADRDAPPVAGALLPIAALTIAGAAAIVFHGALRYFFSQDDFGWLAQARGLIPRVAGPYRYLSAQLYYDVMRPLAGAHALPYHVVSLALHALAATLVFAFVRRSVSAPAAWLGAVFFAVHPASYTALYWISATGDILALGFALGAAMVARRAGPARWWALPLFACALLSKESTVLLPLWIALDRLLDPAASGQPTGERRRWWKPLLDPPLAALVVLAAFFLAWFLSRHDSGAASGSAPYATSFDRTLLLNLLTYLGWTVNLLFLSVRSFNDTIDPNVFVHGAVALAAWLAGLAWRPLRERGWLRGGAWMATFLLPVLVLRNHTYHYYLYAPLAGAAWCVGALADALFARFFRPRAAPVRPAPRKDGRDTARPPSEAAAWGVAIVLGAALTLNGAMLVRKIETYPFVDPALRADPVVDRARIARNVFDGLRAAVLPPGVRLIFWSPDALGRADPAHRDAAHESYWEQNVRGALYDGVAVRVLFPQVRSVEFVRTFRPVDNSYLYALYGIDGRVRLVSPAELDSVRRARSGSPQP